MSAPLLSVESVTKRFRDAVAVDALSFDVRAGEIFGFLGPNGAGKTTTLRMILGITKPDSGSVRFDGAPGVDRARIGYLPEERGLYDDQRVLDTLVYLGTLRGLSPAAARAAGSRWLERLGLADRAKAKLTELSKGMQQKAQLAGALLHEPALAVLDEPFSGLDPINQETLLEIVRELRTQGMTILFSAHQLNLVERLCDRFLLIARGRSVLSGNLDEMRAAVKGGAGETFVLELDARAGANGGAAAVAPSVAACRAAFARAKLGAGDARIEALGGGRVRIEVDLPKGADVGPALAELGAAFAIRHVEMRPISLHELYLHAVRTSLGAAAADTATAGAAAEVPTSG
jgi:ABC-2 type transport system ATP-binding protein